MSLNIDDGRIVVPKDQWLRLNILVALQPEMQKRGLSSAKADNLVQRALADKYTRIGADIQGHKVDFSASDLLDRLADAGDYLMEPDEPAVQAIEQPKPSADETPLQKLTRANAEFAARRGE